MKRLKSSDDLDSIGEKGLCRDSDSSRASSHRSYYHHKSSNGRKGKSPSYLSRYDRSVDEERDGLRPVRNRSSYHSESFNRRKGFDRYWDCGGRGGYGGDRVPRSESFCSPRRDFPKGFRSERDRSRREGSVSSWGRFGGNKDFDDVGKSSSDSVRGSRSKLEDRSSTQSPQRLRDTKSPTWSKDSSSEPSKSAAEVKKREEMVGESGGCSEMEEGELEPELEHKSDSEGFEIGEVAEGMVMEEAAKSLPEVDKEVHAEGVSEPEGGVLGEDPSEEKAREGKVEVEPSEIAEDAMKEVNSSPDCQTKFTDGMEGSKDVRTPDTEGDKKDKSFMVVEVREDAIVDKSLSLLVESEEVKGRDREVQTENTDDIQETTVEKEKEILRLKDVTDELSQDSKGKGKGVAFSSFNADTSPGKEERVERGFRDSIACTEDDGEGPSIRGFELFSSSFVKKPERADRSDVKKLKDEKLTLEPLHLSLSLPNILLPISSCDVNPATGSSSHALSASMSFSGSQQISHNPSCSLTQNSLDNYELSVGSRPVFQGMDHVFHGAWQGQSPNEPILKENPLYKKILMNGNGTLHQSIASQGIINGQASQTQHLLSEQSSKITSGLDRQFSFNKQNVGSSQTGSDRSRDRKKTTERNGSSLCRISNQNGTDQVPRDGTDIVETMITMIDSEPLHVTAKRFQEMTEQSLAFLRESISTTLPNAGRQLQKRFDITLEALLKCPRAQLEIMAALKTGLGDFLLQYNSIPVAVLAEIFLDLRCRNLTCRSILPVDECDCKICSPKNGFCSSCMCLLCSKFDMASNTCSWVGCDVCLHWCHTDCGLRENLIRNGPSVRGMQGMSEMQFHCVACGHPSEMYGFIKEVFQHFAKVWPAQTLSKELEYVRRIFCASKDVKGKQLHDIAEQMLSRLANGSNLPDVYNPILNFLAESGSENHSNGPILSQKEQGEGSNNIPRWAQETVELDSVYSKKASQLERTGSIPPRFECSRSDKHISNSELHRCSLKEPVFDELESIVRIKQAEAKMFQARADDARREAEGLKRIASAKNIKLEEEFASRIAKLRLFEAEQTRNQKLEQLQALERAHGDYFNMKMRLEADIRDLLLKMEATKQNLAM